MLQHIEKPKAVNALPDELYIVGKTHKIVEPKLDGVMAQVHCHPEYGVSIWTNRDISKKLPHLVSHPILQDIAKSGYTVLIGEIAPQFSRSMDSFKTTVSVLNSAPSRAIALQNVCGPLAFYAFDAPYWEGRDCRKKSQVYRHHLLDQLNTDLVLVRMPWDIAETPDAVKRLALAHMEQYEGAVLKFPSAVFGEKTAWVKVKQSITVDGLVTNWKNGNGKYEKSVGSLTVSCIDEETGDLRVIGAIGPGTDEERTSVFRQIDGLAPAEIEELAIIVEVESQGWTASGRLRHPRLLRYRPDRTTPNVVVFDGVRSMVGR